MKFLIFVVALLLPLALWAKDENQQFLTLEAQGIERMEIDCGPGFLKVEGQPEATEIKVVAEIEPETIPWQKARSYISLELKRVGHKAVLISAVKDRNFWDWLFERPGLKINLTVTLPPSIALDIDDGSGDIKITNMANNITLDDGSGDLVVENIAGDIKIDDGSGELKLKNITGNVILDDSSGDLKIDHLVGDLSVDDGSGELVITQVQGRINLDDSSGNISLTQVKGDVKIDDSSGNIAVQDVRGTVILDDGSGNMNLSRIDGDVIIEDDGSGSIFTSDITGKVIDRTEDE